MLPLADFGGRIPGDGPCASERLHNRQPITRVQLSSLCAVYDSAQLRYLLSYGLDDLGHVAMISPMAAFSVGLKSTFPPMFQLARAEGNLVLAHDLVCVRLPRVNSTRRQSGDR
jgi:hypothetical protein